jgi:ParB family chromosome partitioning protein
MQQSPKSKASLVDLTNIVPAKREPAMFRPTAATAPGQAIQNSMLRIELEQWQGADPVRKLDPTTVFRSKWANRHDESYADADFLLLRSDIEQSLGNVQPIKVRLVSSQPPRYEVIFGHRRHQACLDLGLPVLAMISVVEDQKMFADMDRENRLRKNLSPYEQGLMYSKALDESLFPSIRAMSSALGIPHSSMSKSIRIATLPKVVLDVFPSPVDIQFRWAQVLNDLLESDSQIILEKASVLADSPNKLKAADVFKFLAVPSPQEVDPIDPIEEIGPRGEKAKLKFNSKKNTVSVVFKNVEESRHEALQLAIAKAIKDFFVKD